jgi:hypothetical protein
LIYCRKIIGENTERHAALFYFTLKLKSNIVDAEKPDKIERQEYPESAVIFYFEPFEL